MIIIKVTDRAARKMGLDPKDLKEIVGDPVNNFLVDVEELENNYLNFYYMNQFDELIQAFPMQPMLDDIIPDFVLVPSLIGDIQRATFFDGLPFSDEVKSNIHQSGKNYQLSKISDKESKVLNFVYDSQRKLIQGEINRRLQRK